MDYKHGGALSFAVSFLSLATWAVFGVQTVHNTVINMFHVMAVAPR